MLTDRFGHIWPTTLTRRSIKAMEAWTVRRSMPAAGSSPESPVFEERDVPLGFDVTNVVEFLQLELDTDTKFDVLEAWLYPYWKDHELTVTEAGQTIVLKGREAFQEVCDADFVNRAIAILRDLSLAFFGAAGKAAAEEIQAHLDARSEIVRATIRDLCGKFLKNAGPPTPDTSASEPMLTT